MPLLAEELVDEAVRTAATADTSTVPRTMTALVRRRLSLLDPVARECLRAVAVAGTDPDWQLLPTVVGQPEDDGRRRRDGGNRVPSADGCRNSTTTSTVGPCVDQQEPEESREV